MNKNEEFNKILKDIKEIKIQGARNIAKMAYYAYNLIPTKNSKNKLLNSRPTEPMMHNILDMAENKKYSKQILGKTVVSKTGKRFGEVGDISFETRTGELLQILLRSPTSYTEDLDLERSKEGELIIPFSAVIAIGDFVVVAEEDII